MKFTYKAIRLRQTAADKPMAMFAAPVDEIARWSGIPQKKRFGTGEETAGFQREQNASRVKSLRDFYRDENNIIQNPLLCATRSIADSATVFLQSGEEIDDVTLGQVEIEVPDFDAMPLVEIFARVRSSLEQRVAGLADTVPSSDLVSALKQKIAVPEPAGDAAETTDDETEEEDDADEPSAVEEESGDASSALFEESHIVDFWQEIAARHELLKLAPTLDDGEEFLGFTRSALISYLQPVVLVDGQHRLAGALSAAEESLNDEGAREEIETRIANGEDPDLVSSEIVARNARQLPVSLLLSSSPSEQVFQFVVVNQRATPIGRALLGTIVSTSLSKEEMESVAVRLKNAGIHLEESQAITYLARNPQSPFFELVERGMTGDSKDLLQWNVFSSLIAIFRDLRGGKLFGQKNDYASIWRDKQLGKSKLVENWSDEGSSSAFDCWSRVDGPWRDVFIEFWRIVRDKFGNVEDRDKPNFWGRPRESNLFNKVSLTILAADFFEFLVSSKRTIDNIGMIEELVSDWLEDVSLGYFDKDWNLAGIKKDSGGIRKQWAVIWAEYRRKGGNLPDKRLFRQARGD